MKEPERESAIGSRPRRNPLIGPPRGGAVVRVDANDLRAALLRRGYKVEVNQARVGGVAAPEDDDARMDRVGELMAARPEVGRCRDAEDIFETLGNTIIDSAGSMRRAADGGGEALHRTLRQHSRRAAAGKKSQGSRPVSLAD